MNDPYLTDHFHPLAQASAAILQALRADESSPTGDLYKRLVSSGSSRYHPSTHGGEGDASNAPSSHLLHSHSVPLPPPIAQAVQSAKISAFMGLHPPSNLVWVACDGTLYLWRYGSSVDESKGESDAAAGLGGRVEWGGVPTVNRASVMEDVCSFSVGSGQCVVGVGVVRPKRGVFKPSVQWCIAISTPSEVILCALQSTEDDMLRLIPTRFVLPTDNIPMISIRGTTDGRIFMGGCDGCLYEMNYEGQQKKMFVSPSDIEEAIDDYFDGSGELVLDAKNSNDVMLGGKRMLSALTFGGLDDNQDQRRRKCRKINHSSVAGGFSSVVPGVVVKAAVAMFGSSTEAAARKGGPIVSLVLDEERKCLYTLGANGIICNYDLLDTMAKDTNSPPRLASVMDSVATAKLYLESVSCGRMYPPVTTQSIQLGTITFPGGINSAQAGVGGMDGAREILKRHDREVRLGNQSGSTSKLNPREMTNSAGMLHPVSIHLVAGTESKSLTLVAVTGGGLRYYLSSLSSSVITSAQASQGSFDYTARGNDSKLARTRPAKKITFCHIRAPPPYTSSDGSNDGLKIEVAPSTTNMLRSGSGSGIPPGIHSNPIPAGGDGRKGDVVKGYYAKDVFVLALDVEKSNNSTRGNESRDFYSQDSGVKKKPVDGNALLVALLDTAGRIVDTSNTTTSTAITIHNSNNDPTRTSGGISEISILPMCGIRGESSAVLPGGTTFDISSQNSMQSSLMSLHVNSETPSDTELQIGLMPAFTPPKIKFRGTNPTSGAASAIVARNQGRGVISSALSTLSNFIRSGQGYGYQVTSTSGSSGGVQPSASYRVSRRHGCDSLGFSSSSAEIVTRPGQRASAPRPTAPKAARLPTWLITPSAAPMSFQSSMHLNPPGSDSVLVLNAGGLHFFTNSSILNNLASVLMRSSNVAKDESLRNFFTSYGYDEGCAMCFALITSSSSNSNLRSKAEQAALTHARNPSYKLIGTGDGRDPLSAYQFTPSSLYDGLVKFSSRLMRPCWHKAAVVVTEGKPIQSKHSLYSSYYSEVPAKVELLLDDVTLDEIRRPLILLQDMMKKTFVPVVNSVPGASKTRTDSMDVDDDFNSDGGGLYTTAMLNQSRAAQRINNSSQPHDLTADELRKSACQKEDRNMHSLYRLWSRTIQMLNLMAILKHAHSSPALPGVQWGLIHGLTFHQLVTTFEGQQRIEALLNALFSQSENTLLGDLSTEDSQVADMLSRQCYLYFSSASRLTYLGFKAARDALSKSLFSESRKSLSRKAASYLRAAARHWHDPALVVGREVAIKSNSWREIAQSAIDNGSPLALAADELMKLKDAQGVADICLICASNFGGAKVKRDASKELGEPPIDGMFDWEKGLYQQPPAEKLANVTGTYSSSTQIVVSGIKTTSSDALTACHSMLFYYISKLLGQGDEVATDLLRACASSSDVKFLRQLYDELLTTNNVDTLLRIDSSTLESWLNEKKDADLLFKYYSFHGRNGHAGDVMESLALNTNEKIPLAKRIEYLTRAANAYSAALRNPLANEQASVSDLNGRITQITEQLEVATIQQQILTTVQSSKNTDLDQEKMDALSFLLVDVSGLYNDYAAHLNLFDICLVIMETCHQNDPSTIAKLWKSIICEELLPCCTTSRVAFEYLTELRDNSIVQEEIIFGETADDKVGQFDDGSWIPRLKATVTGLGKKLYGKGADYTFPTDLLLETFEGLRHVQSRNSNETSHTWPAKIMVDVGVPFYSIMAIYEGFRVSNSSGLISQLHSFSLMVELLEMWLSEAQSTSDFSPNGNSASMQLARAINQDRLLEHVNSLAVALEGIAEDNPSSTELIYSRLIEVQDTIRNFH